MIESNEMGMISFDFDKREIEKIASTGKLSVFVEKATELFRQNLKAELVNNVSSGSTSLVRFEDDEYGTGPKGPFPHIFAELESITKKINQMERFGTENWQNTIR